MHRVLEWIRDRYDMGSTLLPYYLCMHLIVAGTQAIGMQRAGYTAGSAQTWIPQQHVHWSAVEQGTLHMNGS